jgi:tetratricopeptide (TPR) repeat protein
MAVRTTDRGVELEPEARAALKRGDLRAAVTAARALALAQPDNSTGYFLLGMAAADAGEIAKAIPLIEAAVERHPEAEHLAQLARLLIMLRHDGEAADAARRALALAPTDALTLDTIGCVLARVGEHEASMIPFTAAVASEPGNLDYRYNLAAASGFTGRVEEARVHYEMILAQNPGEARVHYALAILSRQTAQANHLGRLHAALCNASRSEDALRIRYALAKELEDVGSATEAFRQLSEANTAHKQSIGYNFAQDAAIFDALEALVGNGFSSLHAGSGVPSESPIFVIGMPRTGTTLVDRILSSHPDVGSAGELQAMPVAVKKLAGTTTRVVIDADTIMASAAIEPSALGKAYLARASHHRPRGTARFTDKLPANFLYVGHIARALPNARIVCLRRNPLDTIWSNFKNLFASQSAYYAYSYDLLDTARYYARFNRLMALWESLWPGRVLQFSYEALIADQEVQTRRLLEHCGLDWNEGCLSFQDNAAAVATPSAAQVRQPLYRDSVGKWRAHREALEPARAWLKTQGVEVDGSSW